MLARGGKKLRLLTENQIDEIVSWLERDCTLTLKQIRNKVLREFHENVSISIVGNYLEGRLLTLKSVHNASLNVNNENKIKRSEYVRTLNQYIEVGEQMVWIDETNFNLFCRRTGGRSKVSDRAVQRLPASRGPNVHLIGAISAVGIISMERRRGFFAAELANNWLTTIL
ncbi:transposable element-related [Holotrichia oblita]|uniref:Transposable element-related n=1 Tax=Holotrichia oblita TaxID=644536 RepID=A0ACB9TGT9_HOLOL|nr:transposable element-related [Holotrichia oblita]